MRIQQPPRMYIQPEEHISDLHREQADVHDYLPTKRDGYILLAEPPPENRRTPIPRATRMAPTCDCHTAKGP
jgi:hypothetical protein